MPMQTELLSKLNARLSWYESNYSLRRCADSEAGTRGLLLAELEGIAEYEWPHSAYSVLRAMWWTVVHPCPEGEWWREVDILLHVLHVNWEPSQAAIDEWARRNGEESAAKWRRETASLLAARREELLRWPREDRTIVVEWLIVASGWSFVKEMFSREVEACIVFWSDTNANNSHGMIP
jgi:hypothetical protein